MADALKIFASKAPWIMRLLMEDFGFSVEDAAAICGNGGHESNGLQAVNEAKPTVAGSRGGWSWFQWTGPRRVDFEEYCRRNGLSLSSDKAAYNWLYLELKGTESKAVQATKNADTLEEKVEAFEKAYERAGVKHYPSRVKWAERALAAWAGASEAQKMAPWEIERVGPAPMQAPTPVALPDPLPAPAPVPVDSKGEPLDPEQGKSPVEKVIGAGKGATVGGVGGAAVSAAIVYLASTYGLVPPGVDGAALGVAVTTIVTGVATGIAAMIGTYRSKKNAPS